MSSELGQTNNEENDQITIHKPGSSVNIKDQNYTIEEMQARRKDRMVYNLI